MTYIVESVEGGNTINGMDLCLSVCLRLDGAKLCVELAFSDIYARQSWVIRLGGCMFVSTRVGVLPGVQCQITRMDIRSFLMTISTQ